MPRRKPDSPAAALARLRWAGTTPEQRADHARMMVQAREAGRARARLCDLAYQAAHPPGGENRPPEVPVDPEEP